MNSGGKKALWFTGPQLDLLYVLRNELGLNNAEVVRAGMECLAKKHKIEHDDVNPKRNRG